MTNYLNTEESDKVIERKQTFLVSAISDISTYIQLADTKVSIVMGAVVAILVGLATCYNPISHLVKKIIPCSWSGMSFILFTILGGLSVVLTFVFGILTVRGHSCIIGYKSKWFLAKSTKEYSFDEFSRDIKGMTDDDIITNMAAELYKLNDINRQKMRTMKWALRMFSVFLVALATISMIFLLNVI